MKSKIILTNYTNSNTGFDEKLNCHISPQLHKAFSLFLINGNKILLQKRAITKYHSGGLWANSCCSHPQKNITFNKCVFERCKYELGAKINEVRNLGSFIYYCNFGNGMYEYELDNVLLSNYSGIINFNKDEIECVKWCEIESVHRDLLINPSQFAPWFYNAFYILYNHLFSSKFNKIC